MSVEALEQYSCGLQAPNAFHFSHRFPDCSWCITITQQLNQFFPTIIGCNYWNDIPVPIRNVPTGKLVVFKLVCVVLLIYNCYKNYYSIFLNVHVFLYRTNSLFVLK